MFLPPDRQRHSFMPPARAFARHLRRFTKAMVWHSKHPKQRSRFVEHVQLPIMKRFYSASPDGWQCPIFYWPARPGTSGEPVLLSHGLGVKAELFRLGQSGGLATALHRAGYSLYFLSHRGSSESIAPPGTPVISVDHIWEQDIPAALEAIVAHSGFHKVHWMGHGFGG